MFIIIVYVIYDFNRQGDNLYKACIFDLDGTLANTLNSIAFFANKALEKCGHPPIDVQKYRYLVGNGANRLMHRMLDLSCGEGNYTEEDVEKLERFSDCLGIAYQIRDDLLEDMVQDKVSARTAKRIIDCDEQRAKSLFYQYRQEAIDLIIELLPSHHLVSFMGVLVKLLALPGETDIYTHD